MRGGLGRMASGKDARSGRARAGRRRGRMNTEGTLLGLRPGDDGVVGYIGDDHARAQAVRFGIGDGALVNCISVLPGGPVILRAGRQEIAIGRGLAARIEVRPVVVPGVESA